MNFINHLYYGAYQLMIKAGNKDSPEIPTIFFMGMILNLNFFIIIFYLFLFECIPNLKLNSKFIFGFFPLLIVLVLYGTFNYKNKYQKVIKSFENFNVKQTNKSILFVIIYSVISLLLVVLWFYFIIIKNRGVL